MLKSVGFGGVAPYKKFIPDKESPKNREYFPFEPSFTEPPGVLSKERLSAVWQKIKNFWAMLMESIQGGPICPWDCPEHRKDKLHLNVQV